MKIGLSEPEILEFLDLEPTNFSFWGGFKFRFLCSNRPRDKNQLFMNSSLCPLYLLYCPSSCRVKVKVTSELKTLN